MDPSIIEPNWWHTPDKAGATAFGFIELFHLNWFVNLQWPILLELIFKKEKTLKLLHF